MRMVVLCPSTAIIKWNHDHGCIPQHKYQTWLPVVSVMGTMATFRLKRGPRFFVWDLRPPEGPVPGPKPPPEAERGGRGVLGLRCYVQLVLPIGAVGPEGCGIKRFTAISGIQGNLPL